MIDNFVRDNKSVIIPETIWTLKSVQANILLKSCENLAKMFQKMFPESVITKRFIFSKNKC